MNWYETKNEAVIIDLDGTLCDTTHRKHHMEKTPKDWKSFYSGIKDDKPNSWCKTIYDLLLFDGRTFIIFVSGRPEEYRSVTLDWLNTHGFLANHRLFMRKSGDFRKDSEIKLEIYKEVIEPYWDVLFCIDDRKQVVDMWRSQGLVCLQCAEGNF